MSIEYQTVLTTTAVLRLDEPEIRALDALVGYGTDGFLAVFYEKMGKAYLQPHEKGLRALFERIRETCPPAMRAVDQYRKDIREAERRRRQQADAKREEAREAAAIKSLEKGT